MMLSNIAIVHAWFEEVWNQGSEAAIDKYFSPLGMAYGVSTIPLDREGFKQYFRGLRQVFPRLHIGVLEAMEQGNRVSFSCLAILDQEEESPRTIQGMGFVTISNGQFIESTNVWDFLGLLVQIEALPGDVMEKSLTEYVMKAHQ